MFLHDKDIRNYVDAICQQIRWKKAHERISEEMTCHILDSRDGYIEQGFDMQTATTKAIADTGDATTLGTSFDRIHRPKPQWGMLAAVAAFIVLGVIISVLLNDGGDMQRRLIFTAIGIGIMSATYFADFTVLGKHPRSIFFAIILVSLLFLIFFQRFNWLTWHDFRVYGAALSLLFPLAIGLCTFALRNKGILGFILSGVAFMALCFLALLITFTAFFHLLVIGAIILLVALHKNWFGIIKRYRLLLTFIPIVSVILLVIAYIVRSSAFQIARFTALRNPMSDPLGMGFQAVIIRDVVSGAAWLGEGTALNSFLRDGSTLTASEFLPAATTDVMLTTMLYYYGWIPLAIILCALFAFMATGFKRAFKQKSGLGFFVSFAVLATFSFQVLTYVVFNLGFTFTLISLPLISPGNAAIVVNLGLIGFMLSVFRTGDAIVEKKPPQTEAKQTP